MAGMTLLDAMLNSYGSYTIMDPETSEIKDHFIRHVSNAGNFNRLGLNAFLKVYNHLLESEILFVTTDCHKSV